MMTQDDLRKRRQAYEREAEAIRRARARAARKADPNPAPNVMRNIAVAAVVGAVFWSVLVAGVWWLLS